MTRAKDNMLYEVVGQQVGGKWTADGVATEPKTEAVPSSTTSEADAGQQVSGKRKYAWKKCTILSDERIRLTGAKTLEHYPGDLRLVTAMVEVKGKMVKMRFITNNFEWSA